MTAKNIRHISRVIFRNMPRGKAQGLKKYTRKLKHKNKEQ